MAPKAINSSHMACWILHGKKQARIGPTNQSSLLHNRSPPVSPQPMSLSTRLLHGGGSWIFTPTTSSSACAGTCHKHLWFVFSRLLPLRHEVGAPTMTRDNTHERHYENRRTAGDCQRHSEAVRVCFMIVHVAHGFRCQTHGCSRSHA